MFADPAVVSVSGATLNMVRINQDKYSSEYLLRSATDEWRMHIRNTSYQDKRRGVAIDRHNVELIQTVFPVAPATVSTVRKAYVVLENQVGDTLTNPRDTLLGLQAFLTSANISKLLNQES
jgi:hypothetical protein